MSKPGSALSRFKLMLQVLEHATSSSALCKSKSWHSHAFINSQECLCSSKRQKQWVTVRVVLSCWKTQGQRKTSMYNASINVTIDYYYFCLCNPEINAVRTQTINTPGSNEKQTLRICHCLRKGERQKQDKTLSVLQ